MEKQKRYIRKYAIDDSLTKNNICIDLEKSKMFKPLKIFISYGHTETVICEKICECLTQRGHTVWFDANDILPGADWRASIIDGIIGCDTFVAGLSKHYLRDNSVCLDELSIAISVKKGNVKTILLEDENEVCIPGLVSNVQWLDLHDWNERILEENTFNIWFQEKMRELIQTLEAKPDRDFNGQITFLREHLHPNYSISKQAYLLTKHYTERAWLNDKVDTWLDSHGYGKLCVIYGAPGSGKSVFAANYMHYNARVAAAFFCEYNHPQYNNTNNIIRVLSYQLACRLPEYRVMLSYLISEGAVNKMNESELFDYLIVNSLNKSYIGGHETMCILVDGLDECGDSQNNALAEVLAIYAERLPSWLKILVFSRAESSVVASLLGRDCININLAENEEEIQNDLITFVSGKLKQNLDREINSVIIHAIVEKSEGIFLYADLITQGLIDGHITESDLEQIPPGLNAIFYHWFARAFDSGSEYIDEYADALSVVIASKEPLPKEELCRLFGWKNRKLATFMRRLNGYLKEDINLFGKETLDFSHLYIKEWLCSKAAGRYQCSAEDGIYELAQYCLKIYSKSGCEGLTEYEILNMRDWFLNTGISVEIIEKDSRLFWKIMKLGFSCDEDMKEQGALFCYKKADELLGKNIGKESRSDKISALHMCGCSYKKIGDFKRAEQSYRQEYELVQMAELENDITTRDLLIVYENYASFLKFIGKYKDSAYLYERAILIIDQNKDESFDSNNQYYQQSHKIYSDAAINYRELNQPEKSIEYFEKAIKCLEKIDIPDNVDKRNLIIQKVNICLVEEDIQKWEGHLELYKKYAKIGEENNNLVDQAYANSYIGTEYLRQGNANDAKVFLGVSYRYFSELAVSSDDIKWIEEEFISLTRLAEIEYQLTGDAELYEKAIITGETIVNKWFPSSCVIALLLIYKDYIIDNDDMARISSIIENIILIAEKAKTEESYRLKGTLVNVLCSVLERVDSFHIDVSRRIDLYKYTLLYATRMADEDEIISLLEEIIGELISEVSDNLMYTELDDETLCGLKGLGTQLARSIDFYKRVFKNFNITLAVSAMRGLGYIYEKCRAYNEAYEAFYSAAILQRSNMKSELFSYRRVYFSLNDCGRMKVRLGFQNEAIELCKDAVKCINDMYENGVPGDEDDKENLIMIKRSIRQLRKMKQDDIDIDESRILVPQMKSNLMDYEEIKVWQK